MKKKYIVLGIVTVLLVVIAGMLACQIKQDEKEKKIKYDEYTEGTQEASYITYKGEKYKYNYDLKTVLFMGVDEEQLKKVAQGLLKTPYGEYLLEVAEGKHL